MGVSERFLHSTTTLETSAGRDVTVLEENEIASSSIFKVIENAKKRDDVRCNFVKLNSSKRTLHVEKLQRKEMTLSSRTPGDLHS